MHPIMPPWPTPDLDNLLSSSAWPRSLAPSCWPRRSRPASLVSLPASAPANVHPRLTCGLPAQSRHRPNDQKPRISACPAFETRPSRSLPPDENCRGTRPKPSRKVPAAREGRHRRRKGLDGQGGQWPNPRHGLQPTRHTGFPSQFLDLSSSWSSIRAVFSPICARRSRHSSRTSIGKVDCPRLGQDRLNALDVDEPLRNDVAVFVEYGAQSIHQFGALMDKTLARSEQYRPGLLLCGSSVSTKRISGRCAAMTIASASAASFF